MALFDGHTCAILGQLGLAPGGRCLEVGAGGGSVARWLAEQVGPSGQVVATDLDTRWLQGLTWPAQVRVLRHDVTRDPLPEGGFDLIHARPVLVHLLQPRAVLAQLAGALRPGGQLVLEDFDPDLAPACPNAGCAETELIHRVEAAFNALLAQRGVDLHYARALPRLLTEAELTSVSARGHLAFYAGGSPGPQLMRAKIHQVREQLVASERVSAEDIRGYLDLLQDRAFLSSLPLLSAWGRRPEVPPSLRQPRSEDSLPAAT